MSSKAQTREKDYERGIRIADRRKAIGLSQDELAHRVGIGRQALSAIENGGDSERISDISVSETSISISFDISEKTSVLSFNSGVLVTISGLSIFIASFHIILGICYLSFFCSFF